MRSALLVLCEVVLCLAVVRAQLPPNCVNPAPVTQANIGTLLECTEIQGTLQIGDITSAQLQLPNLRSLEGSLLIYQVSNPGFTNLNGLGSLNHVHGNISILQTSLRDLNGLNKLNGTGIQNIDIVKNEYLVNITAFADVFRVTGDVNIADNYVLAALMGFMRMEFIGGSLMLGNLPELVDTLAFGQITHLGGGLLIDNCSVDNLDGFSRLTYIGGDITLQDNDKLRFISDHPGNFNGFGNLQQFQGSILIYGNRNLEHLDTLISPYLNYTNNIVIQNNPSLRNIKAFSAVHDNAYLMIEGTLDITHNWNLEDVNPAINAATLVGACHIINNPKITNFTVHAKLDMFELLILSNPMLTTVVLPSVTDSLQVLDNVALRRVELCPDCHVAKSAHLMFNNNPALRCDAIAPEVRERGVDCSSGGGGGGGGAGMNGGQIFGIVIGCILGMAFVVFVAYRALGMRQSSMTTVGRGAYVTNTYQKLDVNQDTE